jgi:hypothetical protein
VALVEELPLPRGRERDGGRRGLAVRAELEHARVEGRRVRVRAGAGSGA